MDYSILIVDDEKNEREGISRLIKKFGFQLNVSQAKNGEEALKKFENNQYDILLTDIKMPYMDGITLIRELKSRGKTPVFIIYSAYGEFEYAQNAISLGVMEYLLKPIRLEAFEKLFTKVIARCEAIGNKENEKKKYEAAYSEITSYKLQRDLLRYLEKENGEEGEEVLKEMLHMEKSICIPVLLSCYSTFFSMQWDSFKADVKTCLGHSAKIVNKEDDSILVLVLEDENNHMDRRVQKGCETLLEITKEKYRTAVFAVLGSECDNLRSLRKEYQEMKEKLDYQFFSSDSMLVVKDKVYFSKAEKNMLDLYLDKIYTCIKIGDYAGAEK